MTDASIDGDATRSLEEARAAIDGEIEPLTDVETVGLRDALGRVLARDLIASADVPAHDNAAMDGYAVRTVDFEGGAGGAFRIVGRATAGGRFGGRVGVGECVRILTGAVMPDDCDAVVAQEDVEVVGDRVAFGTSGRSLPRPGQHRRLAGEDLRYGAVVIAAGRRLGAAELGLAASVGAGTLAVVRRTRVAVFSTGNELRDVDAPLDPGCIRDSNRYALIGLLGRLGAEIVDLGIVRDEPGALQAAIAEAITNGADAIVTSGGVSAGDADHTRDVMARMGRVGFWKLAIKPGRPMAFGRVAHDGRAAWLFGLPGNPVAVMVVFHALVRAALQKLAGQTPVAVTSVPATCTTALAKAPGRTEFVRGILFRTDDGMEVRPTGAQGSGILRSMSEANCLIVLASDRGAVAAGDTVDVWPFDGLA